MQLVDAALNPDARLVPARAMAVSLLAALEDEDATTALIEICQERSTPERVRKVACVELAKRNERLCRHRQRARSPRQLPYPDQGSARGASRRSSHAQWRRPGGAKPPGASFGS